MTQQTDHVCAHTHPTSAQRRAALIADATVLAQRTFGREAIAALPRRWHADDECAELRFAYAGHDCWLAPDEATLGTWKLGEIDWNASRLIVVPHACPADVAAVSLRTALDGLRPHYPPAAMPHMPRVFDAIRAERERQNAEWAEQNHDAYTWLAILGEEYGELSQAILHDTFGGTAAGTMRDELVQLVAVGVQWLECLERQAAQEGQTV